MTCPNCNGTLPDGAMFCGACGTKLAVAETDPLVGKVVGGRYKVLRRLGGGGMGTVYASEQVSLKRPAALKLLNPELFAQPDVVRRFHAEAELAARLSHPNTVTTYDFGQAPPEEGGMLFIAMELVTGQSLRQVLAREGALPAIRAVDIAEQVAASLWDAHQHGIVHRDLKPDNVMLSERAGRRDFVRVLDFGIAKLRDERAGGVTALPQTHAGSLLGTPQYMSPEQITGAPVDGRTDVYALGCMLWEMLTGRILFNGPTLPAVLSQHMHEAPTPPEIVRPELGIPPGLTSLVMRCLAKHPDHRPPTMEAVKMELAGLRQQLGFSHEPTAPMTAPGAMGVGMVPTPAPVATAPAGPSRAWIGALAVGGVLIVAAVVIGRVQWQWDPELPEAEAEETEVSSSASSPTPPTPPTPSPSEAPPDLGELLDQGIKQNPSGFGAKPTAPPAAGGALMTNTTFGYTIVLPPGFAETQSTDKSSTAAGTIAGESAIIITFAQPADGSMFTDEALNELSDEVISGAGAKLVNRTRRQVGGKNLVSFIADLDQVGLRVEMVLYIRPAYILAVALGSPKASFPATASLRDTFFANNVKFR